MRRIVASLLVCGALGCGGGTATPTAPTTAVTPSPAAGASLCAPASAWRTYTVPVPGGPASVTVWIVTVTPAPGATLRAGDGYTLSTRHVTPAGFTTYVQFSIGDDDVAFRSLLVVSGGGCGFGTFRSQVPFGGRSTRLAVRIWVVPGDATAGSPPSAPARPPDVEASEPLDWTIVS
jgi:hypothetical protein